MQTAEADVSHADTDGWTALHNASARGYLLAIYLDLQAWLISFSSLDISKSSDCYSGRLKRTSTPKAAPPDTPL